MPQASTAVQRRTVAATQRGGAVRAPATDEQRRELGTVPRITGHAVPAVAAPGPPQQDGVTDLISVDSVTDGLDLPDALVPEDAGQRERQVPLLRDRVGVTYARRDEAHEHLVGPWLVDSDVLDAEPLSTVPENSCCSAHGPLRSGSRAA
jgi:hypothetical protein